jgi:hypothetical protein
MKRATALIAVLGFLVAGCGSSSTTATTTTPTNPTFTATMLPANEVPAITNAESTGTGNATITFVVTKDSAGNILTASATMIFNVANLQPTSAVTIAHIHEGAVGIPGAVKVTAVGTAGTVTTTNGAASFTAAAVTVDPALAQVILGNPAGYYFNVHTALNPGGVMRGQLVRVQ